MSDARRLAIDELLQVLADQEREVAATKQAINTLLRTMREQPMFEEAVTQGARRGFRPDQFFGKALATAVREVLETRGEASKAQEILQALKEGGFDFDGLGWQPEGRLRSLSMSLSKNTATFVRLPSGTFGLKSKYPNLPKSRKREDEEAEEPSEAEPVE